jgi:diguanylate cyclase (GGDEF)-like protein
MAFNRRTAVAAACAGGVLLAFVLFLTLVPHEARTRLVVNNVVQLLSAIGAGLVCAFVAWRGSPRRRAGWLAMAVALVGWGLGQTYWSWSEIVARRETPFPSFADLGFLIFPVAAATAVLLFQAGTSANWSRARAATDGFIVATSLFIISWVAVLHDVYQAGGDNRFGFAISLAYPVSDIVVGALALLLISRLTTDRVPMVLLASGLIAMGIADGGFTYLSTAGTYQTGSVIDVAWVAAFLLCAVAAVSDFSGEEASGSQTKVTKIGLFLPLLPLVVGMTIVVIQAWHSHLDHTLVTTGGLLMSLVVARQMLVLTENTRLVATVQQREEQLRHQAFHDPLTGLANRLLFRDRLEHAAALRQREGAVLTVLFLDLDDFKSVNDKLGHAAGDALLVDVAERLRACLRQGDTVARLGGDEFAVLLEDGSGSQDRLAARIVDSMEVDFQLGTHRVQVSASVGVATVTADGPPGLVSDRLLHCADVAMYAAKRDAKGSYVVYDDGMQMSDDADGSTSETDPVGATP